MVHRVSHTLHLFRAASSEQYNDTWARRYLWRDGLGVLSIRSLLLTTNGVEGPDYRNGASHGWHPQLVGHTALSVV
jgi:hypothetical protein